MAAKIDAGDDVKRGDMFWVDPFKIVMKEDLRGRHKPPTEEQIIEMAESMMDNTQQQPVQCRKLGDNRLQLNLGFTRTAAARLIRTGFTDSKGNQRKDEEFKLKVVISDANDKQAFKNNIVENAHRNQTSPIDDAHNHRECREKYGMTDPEITELYRYKDVNKVGRLRRLLSLNSDVQDLVHAGTMSVTAAIDLLDMPEDKQAEAIKAATKDGKVSGAQVRAQVRSHLLADTDTGAAGANGTPAAGTGGQRASTPASKAMSMREIREFFDAQSKNEDSAPELVAFAKTFILFMKGQRSEKYVTNAYLDLKKKK
jgi:ParB/RepB/Spo0J family partition protein